MYTFIAILLLTGGGYYFYRLSQTTGRRELIQTTVKQREQHPFKTDQAFKEHIASKIPASVEAGLKYEITEALFEFFAKFSLTGIEFPTVDALLAKYPKLSAERAEDRVNMYPEWRLFELEANLWSKPELWQLVDTIIDDVVKAALKIIPSGDAILVLPSTTPNALQPFVSSHRGPEALYTFLCIGAERSWNRRLLLGPGQAFNEMAERISTACSGLAVPDDMWFQHAFLFARTGSGKTNALSYLINCRLDQVARDEATVVVMDSGVDLIHGLSRLKRFAPGGDLHGKLLHLDFRDAEYSVGINPFEVPDDTNLSPDDLRTLQSTTVRMLNFVYEAILDMPLSGRQGMVLTFLTELLLSRKGSTLGDLLTLVRKNGIADFQSDIDRMDKEAQDYFVAFDTTKDAIVLQTKTQVETKIFGLRALPALRHVLRAPKTTLKLEEELQQSKVILIDMPGSHLDAAEIEGIGRFFLSRILRATLRRLILNKTDRLKTYIFIDECQTTLGENRDTSIDALFDQARKSNVSLMLASTRPDLLHEKVRKAIFGNAAIRMAARVTPENASTLAAMMRTEPEFILDPPKHTFPTFVDGLTPTASLFAPPEVDFNNTRQFDHMSKPELVALKERMREKYYYRVPAQPPPDHTDNNLDDDNTKAAPY